MMLRLMGRSLSLGSLSGAIAVFGNFFYGWSFPQVAMTCMFPLVPAAYVAPLLFDKEWHLQPIATDFKPSVFVACFSLTLAVGVSLLGVTS